MTRSATASDRAPHERSKPIRLITAAAVLALAGPAGLLPTIAGTAPLAGAVPRSPITHTVIVGSRPSDIAISQSLGKGFVVSDGAVSVVSLLTHRRLTDINTGVQDQNAIALMRSNTQAYITSFTANSITVIDTETGHTLRRIAVGPGPVDVVKVNTVHGQRAYVALQSTGRLCGIETRSGRIVQRVALPHGVQTLTAAPGGRSVWAGSSFGGHIYQVDTTKGKLERSINVARVGPITSIAFTRHARRAWVAGPGGIAVVNTRTGKTVKFLPVLHIFHSASPNMGAVAITGSGRWAYVQDSTFPDNPARGSVSIINTNTYRVSGHIRLGNEPLTLAIDNKRATAYVPNYDDNTITYFAARR